MKMSRDFFKRNTEVQNHANIYLSTLNFILLFFALMQVYQNALFYNLPFPANTFLSPPESRFGDLYGVHNAWQANGFSGVGYAHSYFPGMYLMLEVFHKTNVIFQWPGIWMLMIYLTLTISLVNWTRRSPIQGIVSASIFVFSYPVLFIWSTGNLEGVIAMILLLAIFAFSKNKLTLFVLLIGFAASAKLFPLVFLFILYWKKEFRVASKLILLGVLSMLGTMTFSILFLRGGVLTSDNSFMKILENSNQSRGDYAELMYYSEASIPYGHSFLNGLHAIFGMDFLPTNTFAFPIAILLTVVVFLPSLFIAYRHRFPDWVVLAILASWTCATSPTSTDYRLTYFWPALVILLKAKSFVRKEILLGLFLILILAPKAYFPLNTHPQATMNVYLGSIMILLVPLLSVVLFRCGRSHNSEVKSIQKSQKR